MILLSTYIEWEITGFLRGSAHGITVTSYFLRSVTSFFWTFSFFPLSLHFPPYFPISPFLSSRFTSSINLFLLSYSYNNSFLIFVVFSVFSRYFLFLFLLPFPPPVFSSSFLAPHRAPGLFFVLSDGTRLGIHYIM